jgi:YidC/Oxa1 family membrane protein insertase
MKSDDNRNLFLAIGLSLLVILGWNWFYGMPEMQKARQPQQTGESAPLAQRAPGAPPNAVSPASPAAVPENPGLPATGNAKAEIRSRDQALAATPRVRIASKGLTGSINLKGGLIDDVSLNGYRETIDPGSPHITIFSPLGSPDPYYADT